MEHFSNFVSLFRAEIQDIHLSCANLAVTVVVTVVTLLYLLYKLNLRKWTFDISEWDSYESAKGVRSNKSLKTNGKFIDSLDHKYRGKGLVKTVYDGFIHGVELSGDQPCLGHMVDNFTRFEWFSYNEVDRTSRMVGKFLRVSGVQRQQCVGIYGSNSCEWVMAEVACLRQSIVSVPVYDTLGIDSVRHTINETEMAVLFCDSEQKLKRILDDRKNFSTLKKFVLLSDKVEDATFSDKCKVEGIEFLTWSQARAIGMKHPELCDDPPKPEDLFLVLYTSGTTGLPKGVMLTHANLVGYLAGIMPSTRVAERRGVNILTPNDINLLYLPLAHSYGQTAVVWCFYIGARTAFPSGNILRLMQDAQICKPTYFPLVPRVMNRVYTKIVEETKSGFKGWLFWKCYEGKKALLKKNCVTRNSIYDWLVFRKIQKMLGGNVAFMTCGSAPIAAEVLEFWRIVFGAITIEGYGQTESSGAATVAIDTEGGNVGHPCANCHVRLLDLPELGYTNDHNPPQGEICLKGLNITQGYYKRTEITKESFTADGWLLTGDIGEFLPNGSLRIIDRRKHIFKLSQGEYIAPEKVESTYAQCPLVAQVFVDGNSLQTFVVAIVVPDEKEAKQWATKHGLEGSSLTDLCDNKDFKLHVLETLVALGKKNRLNSLEQIKSLHLHPEPFTVENGLMTPTMKNKRNELRRRFQPEIDALYNAGPIVTSRRE